MADITAEQGFNYYDGDGSSAIVVGGFTYYDDSTVTSEDGYTYVSGVVFFTYLIE